MIHILRSTTTKIFDVVNKIIPPFNQGPVDGENAIVPIPNVTLKAAHSLHNREAEMSNGAASHLPSAGVARPTFDFMQTTMLGRPPPPHQRHF